MQKKFTELYGPPASSLASRDSEWEPFWLVAIHVFTFIVIVPFLLFVIFLFVVTIFDLYDQGFRPKESLLLLYATFLLGTHTAAFWALVVKEEYLARYIWLAYGVGCLLGLVHRLFFREGDFFDWWFELFSFVCFLVPLSLGLAFAQFKSHYRSINI